MQKVIEKQLKKQAPSSTINLAVKTRYLQFELYIQLFNGDIS